MTDNLVQVARLLGAHGVRGDVRLQSLTEDPEACFAYGDFLDEAGAPLLSPLKWRAAKSHFIVTPREPRSKEAWDAMRGEGVFVPRARLPALDAEDEYYVEDLVGAAIVSPAGETIGSLRAVQNFGAGDLLEIAPAGGGPTVFVPFTEAAAPEVDPAARRIVVADFAAWAEAGAGGRAEG